MNCTKVGELMQRKIDFDLSAQEEIELESHLAHCSKCKQLFDRLSLLSAQLEQLPQVTPPFSIVDSILPKLDEIYVTQKQPLVKDEEATSISSINSTKFYKQRWFLTTASVLTTAAAILLTINLTSSSNDRSSSSQNTAEIAAISDALANEENALQSSTENMRQMEIAVTDQSGPPAEELSPESSSTDNPTGFQVDQLKINITNKEIIEAEPDGNENGTDDTNEQFFITHFPTASEDEFMPMNEEEIDNVETTSILPIEEENIKIISPDEKVYLLIEAHNIAVYDFNTQQLLKTIEIPIEGEVSFAGWHESGVEFYIDVVDSNMQTNRITYSLGL